MGTGTFPIKHLLLATVHDQHNTTMRSQNRFTFLLREILNGQRKRYSRVAYLPIIKHVLLNLFHIPVFKSIQFFVLFSSLQKAHGKEESESAQFMLLAFCENIVCTKKYSFRFD